MNGIISVLKPPGMTSFDVVAFLRGVLKVRKIGHTGTLDPGAVGVLPVCVGSATKAIEFMMDKDKVYRAEMTLGLTTDTEDSSGEILAVNNVVAGREEIESAVKSFIGKYAQTPPMYSAVKVGGKKLYELARSGITVDREERVVEVYSVRILQIREEQAIIANQEYRIVKVVFDVACSKGTYIRTLCADIGNRLGCGGLMSFLIRLRAGSFDISSALTVEEIIEAANNQTLKDKFFSIDKAFMDFPEVILNESEEKRFLNGQFLDFSEKPYALNAVLKVYSKNKLFIALGEVIKSQGKPMLKSKKIFSR
ncbi:MAG: tRNA pseudouridine(55) synthase TruB [Clostridia bacterium]|nr:tRNA pseudouridine(55) synthase TruB [Clostridia bacterium]